MIIFILRKVKVLRQRFQHVDAITFIVSIVVHHRKWWILELVYDYVNKVINQLHV